MKSMKQLRLENHFARLGNLFKFRNKFLKNNNKGDNFAIFVIVFSFIELNKRCIVN